MKEIGWSNIVLIIVVFVLIGIFIGVRSGESTGAQRQRKIDGACMPGLYHGTANEKILCIGGRGELWEVQLKD